MSNPPSGNSTPGKALRSPMKKARGNIPTISTTTAQLLTSTKALLQSLTSWANKSASVNEVSTKFVQVGDDFKALRKSYVGAGVDISDIKDIPSLLRGVLEESLILEPSQQTLDLFLPKVGQIVAELMKILKEKQAESHAIAEARKNSETSQRSVSGPAATPSTIDNSPRTTTTPRESNSEGIMPDPISRLQNNHSLMRRASRRFSAYQTSKILSLNTSTSAYNSPRPKHSPILSPNTPGSPLQEEVSKNIREFEFQNEVSKIIRDSEVPQKITFPLLDPLEGVKSKSLPAIEEKSPLNGILSPKPSRPSLSTVYLKLGNKVKKVEIRLPTTTANLRVLFTQKFGFSPTDSTPPPIYIQESNNDIAYELDDINEIRATNILSLYEPDLASVVVKHMESQIDFLKDEMIKLEDSLVKRIEKIQFSPTATNTSSKSLAVDSQSKESTISTPTLKDDEVIVDKQEISALKFELSKARQSQTLTKQKLTTSMNEIVELIQKFQSISLSPAGVISNPYMEHCKTKVSSECETLVNRIDDLQDVIETLKLDISKRGSTPSQKQIMYVQKEMETTKNNLSSLTKYMSSERKNWNSRWQSELTAILEEQEFFKEQETILQLLDEDLGSANETYSLIVKCCEEMDKNPRHFKPSGPNLPIPDPHLSTKDMRNALLDEVRNLKPDHDSRVEAIIKAEKVREREKELLNSDMFEEELGDFVGNEKLKKSGGIDEIERKRQMQDEANLKGQFGAV